MQGSLNSLPMSAVRAMLQRRVLPPWLARRCVVARAAQGACDLRATLFLFLIFLSPELASFPLGVPAI